MHVLKVKWSILPALPLFAPAHRDRHWILENGFHRIILIFSFFRTPLSQIIKKLHQTDPPGVQKFQAWIPKIFQLEYGSTSRVHKNFFINGQGRLKRQVTSVFHVKNVEYIQEFTVSEVIIVDIYQLYLCYHLWIIIPDLGMFKLDRWDMY